MILASHFFNVFCKIMLFGFENAFYDTASIYELDCTNQRDYVRDVLGCLSMIMPDFTDFKFYFFCATANIEPDSLKDTYPRKILIQWEDQLGTEPSERIMSSFFCVFKTHLRKPSIKYGNLFSYPLGIPRKIKEMPVIPICERKYDVFYSGNLNKNRVSFYEALTFCKPTFKRLLSCRILRLAGKYEYDLRWRNWALRLKSLVFKCGATSFNDLFDSSYIKFTRFYEGGLSPDEYAEILAQSKIVLSPKGFYNTECFRFYEALRQGCIVITEKLPVTDYYNSDCYIEVETWKGVSSLVNSILADKNRLEKLSLHSRDYYDKVLSPMGVAKYVVSKIMVSGK